MSQKKRGNKIKKLPKKLIIDLYLEGKTTREIADMLTRNGLPISHTTISNRLTQWIEVERLRQKVPTKVTIWYLQKLYTNVLKRQNSKASLRAKKPRRIVSRKDF